MKLSLQNVCIIFGVTLVHLVVIAAISPGGGEGAALYGPAGADAPEPEGFGEDAAASPITEGTGLPAVTESGESGPPVDLPARHREDAGLTSEPHPDPVAATRSPAVQPRS